jgi:hypothetical protein
MSEEKSGGGCFKIFLIILLIITLIVVGGAYYIYSNFSSLAGSVGAQAVEAMSEGLFSDPSISEEERKKGKQVLKDFADRIRAGEVNMQQGLAVIAEVTTGPIMIQIGTRQLTAICGSIPELEQSEKDSLMINSNRYSYGASIGKISKESSKEILNLFMETGTDESGKTSYKLREDVRPEDCRQANSKMAQATDAAGIAPGAYDIKISELVATSIKRGMENPEEILGADAMKNISELPQ